MHHQLTPGISKRVADYFAVVGAGDKLIPSQINCQNTDTKDPLKTVFSATVTDRYPLIDRANVPFPDGVALFCFPNGIELQTECKNPLFYSFVHTSELGFHMMGCCLLFYEPITNEQCKSISAVDESLSPEERISKNYEGYYVPRCLCIISHWPFILSFKKILCQLYRISLTPSAIPIERYICNFIDDVPAPPAGLVDITYYLGDHAITFRCPPANQPNVWSGVPMGPLFECLDPDNILMLLSAVLVRRHFFLYSASLSNTHHVHLMCVFSGGATNYFHFFSVLSAHIMCGSHHSAHIPSLMVPRVHTHIAQRLARQD